MVRLCPCRLHLRARDASGARAGFGVPLPLPTPTAVSVPSRGTQGAAEGWRLAVHQGKASHRKCTYCCKSSCY